MRWLNASHNQIYADVVELVDTLVLGTSAVRREGSSPFIRTKTCLYPTLLVLQAWAGVNGSF